MAVANEAINLKFFESAGEMHDAHEELLGALEDLKRGESSAETKDQALLSLGPRIKDFLARGAATGAYVEEISQRTACQTILDFWASKLGRTDARAEYIRLAPFDASRLPELPDEPCPYVGLESFREATGPFFFGREDAIKEVVKLLRSVPLVVVCGASGSGKSSLVLGGVLPRLKNQEWAKELRVLPSFVPGTAALEHLATCVRGSADGLPSDLKADVDSLRRDPEHLRRMLGGDEAPATLITIDQFEEIFTLSTEADRDALAGNLSRLLQGAPRHRLLLTVREEFETKMKERLLGSFHCQSAWFPIPELDWDQLQEAIVKPADKVKLHIKQDVVNHLVKRVIHQPAALPLLQFTLRSLWDHRDRNRITWEVYKKIGGDPLVVLAKSAKAFLDKHQDPETLDEIKRILLELVRVDERLEAYRQPVAMQKLLAPGKANTRKVLELLETADFVRITPGRGGEDPVVEVKHESLVRNWPDLVNWIGEKRDRFRRRLALTDAAKQWDQTGRPDDRLLIGALLTEAAEQPDQSELEKEYIRASEAFADKVRRELSKINRKLKNRLIVALISLVVAAALLGATVWEALEKETQRKRADDEAKASTNNALAALEGIERMSDEISREFDSDAISGAAASDILLTATPVLVAVAPSLEYNTATTLHLMEQSNLVFEVFTKFSDYNYKFGSKKQEREIILRLKDLSESQLRALPNSAEAQRNVYEASFRMGDIAYFDVDELTALAEYKRALDMAEVLSSNGKPSNKEIVYTPFIRSKIGDIFMGRRQWSEAIREYMEALRAGETILQTHVDNPVYKKAVADAQMRLAKLYVERSKTQAANPNDLYYALLTYRSALNSREQIVDRNPNSQDIDTYQSNLSRSYREIGDLYNQLRQPDQALDYYSKALNIDLSLMRENSSNIQYQLPLVQTYIKIGDVKAERKRGGDDRKSALNDYSSALSVIERFGPKHPNKSLERLREQLNQKVRSLGTLGAHGTPHH
jgi:tetratricopeptide (TPR) repeat protein